MIFCLFSENATYPPAAEQVVCLQAPTPRLVVELAQTDTQTASQLVAVFVTNPRQSSHPPHYLFLLIVP